MANEDQKRQNLNLEEQSPIKYFNTLKYINKNQHYIAHIKT